MTVEIGGPILSEASTDASVAAAESFSLRLRQLGHRRDTADKARALAATLTLGAGTGRFSLDDLEAPLRVHHGVSVRQARHLLDGGGFDVEGVRLSMISELIGDSRAIVLEQREERPLEGRPYDVVTATFVGPRFAVPVGWRRSWGPPDARGEQGPDWESIEHDGAVALLSQLRSDVQRLGLLASIPPLISFDLLHGQCDEIRHSIGELGFESIFELSSSYAGYKARSPLDSWRPRLTLADQLPFMPGAPPPAPQLHEGGLGREFIVPYRQGEPSYAMARPGVLAAPGELGGHRARLRAAELGELIAAVERPEAAMRLHLLDFKHQNDEGFEVAATLASAYSATLAGRFLPASC